MVDMLESGLKADKEYVPSPLIHQCLHPQLVPFPHQHTSPLFPFPHQHTSPLFPFPPPLLPSPPSSPPLSSPPPPPLPSPPFPILPTCISSLYFRVSQHLLDACKRAVDIDSPSKRPAGVRVLINHLVPHGVPVSLESFEGLLTECFKRENLSATVHVFRCMTQTYRIAPSRQVRTISLSLTSMLHGVRLSLAPYEYASYLIL